MSIYGGLLLALFSAFFNTLGFLWRYRGARAAPDVDIRRPLHTVIGLFRSKWWAIGYAVAIVAWLLHVGALGLAPLSLVQTVLASGFIVLAVLADRMFGFEVGGRAWIGIALTAVGLAVLGGTAYEIASETRSDYPLAAMIAFEAGLIGAGAGFILWPRGTSDAARGLLLGAGAGLLFTVTHVGIKGLSDTLSSGGGFLLSPWTPVVVAAAVGAFFASARSLQLGEAVPVIAITSIAGNLSAILAGVVVFGDPLGDNAFLVTIRVLAFLLVVAAAALIPGPMRAAKSAASPESGGEQPSTSAPSRPHRAPA